MALPETTSELSAPAIPPSNRPALLIVFLVVFIDLLGFGIVLPLLPVIANGYVTQVLGLPPTKAERGGPPTQVEPEGLTGLIIGLLMASFSLMQFLFAPMWGRISDRIGRRPILLLGLAGSVIFYTLFGLASELGERVRDRADSTWLAVAVVLLYVSRLGAGIAGATISTAQAVIADTTTPERRARGMAMIGAAFGIGFTFGPLLGFASLFIENLPGAPGFLAAGLSLLALLFGLARLPETCRGTAAGAGHLRRRIFDTSGTLRVLRTPQVGILVLTFFLATFAFGGLESTLALVNRLLLTGVELTREERAQLL